MSPKVITQLLNPATSPPLATGHTGLDRFGRIVGEHWVETSEGNAERQWAEYGYDRASNRKWRRNALAHANGDRK